MGIKTLSTNDIDEILTNLKSNQQTILACIKHLKQTYNISLIESSQIVLSSKVWSLERDQWIKNHEEAELEFLKAMGDDCKKRKSSM